MTLEELLEYVGKEYLDDRTDLLDGDSDELWSDRAIIRYLNEAEERLCRRAWVLIDVGHSKAGVITLQAGKGLYKLHPSVLRVYKATPSDTDIPLNRTTDERLDFNIPSDPDSFDVNVPSTATPGRPLAFATDAGTRLLRVHPVPRAEDAGLRLLLKVARLPACKLTLEDLKASPEVAEEYHIELARFAAGRCLTLPTVDSDLKADGREALREFDAFLKEARRERLRQEHADGRPRFASSTAYL